MPSTSFARTQFHASPEVLAEMERVDMEKLGNIVQGAVSSVSYQTGMTENEVMSLVCKLRVEMVGEIKGVLDNLAARGELSYPDTAKLGRILEGAIRSIADATDLDTAEITEILSREPWTSVDIVVKPLRIRSRIDRSDQV
jgi:uncharacterized protein YidB (DUF937 family)